MAPRIKCDSRTKLRVKTTLWQHLPDGTKRVYRRGDGSPARNNEVVVARAGRRVPLDPMSGKASALGLEVDVCYSEWWSTLGPDPEDSTHSTWRKPPGRYHAKVHVKQVGKPGWLVVRSVNRDLYCSGSGPNTYNIE